MFFFCFDAGKVYTDHLQHIDMSMSMGMSFAGVWTITRVFKIRKRARERVTLLSIIAVLLIPSIIGGFLTGKEVQYPAESRALVQKIQEHARQVKTIKEQIAQKRQAFTEPEQLLAVQPLVASWGEHINEISKIDRQIMHDTLPSVVAAILKVMNEALVFDKRQIQNIDDQIEAIRGAKNLNSSQRGKFYMTTLMPLMQKEDEIEKQRQAANLEQRIREAATK